VRLSRSAGRARTAVAAWRARAALMTACQSSASADVAPGIAEWAAQPCTTQAPSTARSTAGRRKPSCRIAATCVPSHS
jgi:hypothetical protein